MSRPRPKSPPNLVKIAFASRHFKESGVAENVWAESLNGDRYRIRNSPFYALGFSFLDVVHAVMQTEDARIPVVSDVVLRSGHSTYRLFLEKGIDNNDEFRRAWEAVESLGCSFEGMNGKLLAVDVPPETDIFAVYRLFEQGARAKVWDFEEAHCAHDVSRAGPAA